jgi:Card1-like, endonuclease domain
MTTPDVQVVLVSAQAAPNLLAALDPAMKPGEAVLMVSGKMAARADDLEAVLREAGVKTTRIPIPDEHDYAKLENSLLELASEREGQSIALNVTGGTKLMALAFLSVAQAYGWPAFYVDADTDEVIWLGKGRGRHKLSQQLRLTHYLRGYGFALKHGVTRPQPSQRHNALLRTLVMQVGSLEQPLSQLNWLAQKSEESGTLSVELSPRQLDSRGLDTLLRNFADAGVLRLQGDTLVFSGEDARDFSKGGWLEQHVYRTVCDVSGDLAIRDKAANLLVVDANGVENELDIAFMASNRLFVVECKTARMDKPEAPKANDTLFKLAEICRRVGGLGTRGMLASYRPLRDSEKNLARALNIELVCGTELARLDEKLKIWVRP